MAVLNKIRQRSLFLIIVIAMALFSFVLADVINKGGGSSIENQDVIATINGEDISRTIFANKVKNLQDQYRGGISTTQAVNRIWDQEVRAQVYKTEYEALGIGVEANQMRDLIEKGLATYPEFQNDAGLFDQAKMDEFISNLRDISPERVPLGPQGQQQLINYDDWKTFEANMMTNGKTQIFNNLVKAGLQATLAEGKLEYKMENEEVNIKYVQIPYSSIPDSIITVTKSDINKYINDNKTKYEVEESRDIIFVEFKDIASSNDEDEITERLQQTIDDKEKLKTALVDGQRYVLKKDLPIEYRDSLMLLDVNVLSPIYKANNSYNVSKIIESKNVADSVKSSHIIVPYAGAFQAGPDIVRSRDDAKSIVDSLLPLVKNNKTKFNQVATQINTDGTKANNGEVGWTRLNTINYQSFDIDYADFIFYNPKGTVDIVESKFGYHIIRIDEAKNYERAVKLATLTYPIEPSEKTSDSIYRQTSKFTIAAKDSDLKTAADTLNYTAKPVSSVKALDENIPGLNQQRSIVRWVFEEDTKVDEIKQFDLQGGGYAVVQLTAINKKGLMASDKARVTALPAIKKQKKAEQIKQRIALTSTLDEVASSESQTVKTAVALTMKNPVLSGSGREPKVIGTAFGLAQGQRSKPIEGENGIYIIEVTKITPAPELPSHQSRISQLLTTRIGELNSKLFPALKEAAEIEDNRAIFY